MIKVTQVKALKDYTLQCTLSDGRIVNYHVADIEKFDTELIMALKNHELFNRVFLEFGTPTWPNGYDICPDVISQEGLEVNAKQSA